MMHVPANEKAVSLNVHRYTAVPGGIFMPGIFLGGAGQAEGS
jgi:hypothetical protein